MCANNIMYLVKVKFYCVLYIFMRKNAVVRYREREKLNTMLEPCTYLADFIAHVSEENGRMFSRVVAREKLSLLST